MIHIPNVDRDEKIGSAFNYLFNVIHSTEKYKDSVLWDLSDISFLHPFFFAPLSIYKQMCEIDVRCINKPNRISSYLDLTHFEKPLIIDEGTSLKEKMDTYSNKSFLPVCCFDLHKENIDDLQSILQNTIRKQSNADCNIVMPLSYLLGELIDNMYEHSHGKHGYIYAQYLKREDCIDLVLADDGITIFGSYVNCQMYMDYINNDESIALRLANEGHSTKNLPNAENRGYGISSSKEILVNGLKGSFFMLSGGAFHRYDSNTGSTFVKLPDEISWNGTIILMRIPVKVPSDFDFYKYAK